MVVAQRRLVAWRACVQPGSSTILPDGCMDIIWTGDQVLIAGPDTSPNVFTTAIARSMVGVRFAPGVGAAVIGHDASAMRDQRLDAQTLWGRVESEIWTDRLSDCSDPARTLAELITRRPAPAAPGPLDAVVRLLRDGATVAESARQIGITERTLHRMSLRQYGYGVRMLNRILRMQHAMRLLGAPGGTESDISAIAYRVGYADHPHMCRDFRELTGQSPSDFRAQHHPNSQ